MASKLLRKAKLTEFIAKAERERDGDTFTTAQQQYNELACNSTRVTRDICSSKVEGHWLPELKHGR